MYEKIKKFLTNFEEYLCGVLLTVMVTIAFLNVVTRYFIKYSISFTEELEVNLFVWLVLLGASIAFKRSAHLSVSLIYEKFSTRNKKRILTGALILTMFFFIILINFSIRQVSGEILLGVTTESLAIPVWWYTIGVPIFSTILIIRLIQQIIKIWKSEVNL